MVTLGLRDCTAAAPASPGLVGLRTRPLSTHQVNDDRKQCLFVQYPPKRPSPAVQRNPTVSRPGPVFPVHPLRTDATMPPPCLSHSLLPLAANLSVAERCVPSSELLTCPAYFCCFFRLYERHSFLQSWSSVSGPWKPCSCAMALSKTQIIFSLKCGEIHFSFR